MDGKSDNLGLVDTNHNDKNARYQMIGGSWATVTDTIQKINMLGQACEESKSVLATTLYFI
eukprot:14229828-Ditylum_brightwellii.AAC.1